MPLNKRAQVQKITGLSPTVSLTQHETKPSSLATLATASDLNELFGVLYSKYGKGHCPKHLLTTEPISIQLIAQKLLEDEGSKTLAICAPLVEEKKGNFEKLLEKTAEKGFVSIYCDGQVTSLSPAPKLNKEKKHTIKVIIDYIKGKNSSQKRLLASLETAAEIGQGYIDVIPCDQKNKLIVNKKRSYSLNSGCPTCGYSWPKLDSRYFSANSLGKCSSCNGLGSTNNRVETTLGTECSSCNGTGIHKKFKSFEIEGETIHFLYKQPVKNILEFVKKVPPINPAQKLLLNEIKKILQSINDIGLSYLSPCRKIETLSLGEHQRVRLASILSQELTGVLYVLDEPSQGLHPQELNKLMKSLVQIKEKGNTIILVDHDLFLLQNSEWIIDLGPGGGRSGGFKLAEFAPKDWENHKKSSLTAKLLFSNETQKTKKNSKKGF